ncbi:MAG: tol-pal system-associated acyl-CoA thioesterase [Gammaproteobacteria bacterium]|jgi:acyl-CoA thioester hydrolase|nr:MAG: tol-pal system-associated acyl-CoA thioesterase [Gammaproteobacteria bacterium]|tara:strand:+ start:2538 stop:2942 length:405 start_codon:yes stop_codon:yes gene_type:complete
MDSIEVRIYYEDTDAQGVVFYANYLKYFERARTEFLRKCGYKQDSLLENGIIFIVNKLDVHYKKPVLLDQVIKIESSINILKKASFYFYQKVILNSEVMCEANILCGCVDLKTKKPIPLPEDLRMKMLEKKNAN